LTAYTADSIKVLKGLEGVRKRPSMYIAGTGSDGYHQLLREILDNAVDEALAGYASEIVVTLHGDGSASVIDNGRGVPVDVMKGEGRPAIEVIYSELHAGGKFEEGAYKVSGGLHGVGASVVNALSDWMLVDVYREGKNYRIKFGRGRVLEPLCEVGPAPKGMRGTRVHFMPDQTVFEAEVRFDYSKVRRRMREVSFLAGGLKIILKDERSGKEEVFQDKGGVASFAKALAEGQEFIYDKPILLTGKVDEVEIDVGLIHTTGYLGEQLAYANMIATRDGGTHLSGFRAAYTRALNQYAKKANLSKNGQAQPTGEDLLEGLFAVISVKLPQPQFEGQTKGKLLNPEAQSATAQVVYEKLAEYLEENPRIGKLIFEKATRAAQAREAARKARDLVRRANPLENDELPGKLADCQAEDPAVSEIYIVEGDSAGGCLAGDTRIPLASGLTKTMRELADDWELGIQHFGYATNETGDIRIVALIEPRLTKRQAAMVEVVLDNGARIRCTPDHPFRLRDGSYQSASELWPGQSLVPFKTRLTQEDELPGPGYEMVWMNGRGEWNHTHHLADLYNLLTGVYTRQAGNTRHHLDFNKLNNDPRNIRRMFWRDHQRLHAELAGEMAKRLWQDPAYRERKLRQLSEQAIRQWQNPAYRKYKREQVRLQRQDQALNEKLVQGFQEWFAALTPDEYAAYCERMRELQAAYWADPAHRREQAQRTRQFFEEHSEARDARQAAALRQWEEIELRAWRAEKTREQWRDEAYRCQHSAAVSEWWQAHPEHREKIVAARQRQWGDADEREKVLSALARWRETTSVTVKRARIRAGHRLKALLLLSQVLDSRNVQQAYERLRLQTAPTAPRYDRLVKDYFAGDESRLLEAAANVNCKVVAVRSLAETADVYDLTVEGYHNFALAAGVFVHNSAKQGRERRFQAILPLKGKILNVEKAQLGKILKNAEIRAMVAAIGAGLDGTGDEQHFNLELVRYHRIIIMTDADVDGSHIRTLLLTFFYRYMRPIIDAGYLYIAQPPLYGVKFGRDKELNYVFSDVDLQLLLKQHSGRKAEIQRFKGLGEMNPEQLWETTMNPETRLLKRVTIEDALEASETFEMLMGSEVPPRREFIEQNAHLAQLDV